MRASKYDAVTLAPVVKSSRTLVGVLRQLGLRPTGGNYRMISHRIRLAGLDTSHFRQRTIEARCAAVPAETLAAFVAQCTSVTQVLSRLELPPAGRSHAELSRRIRTLGIDTAHFRGSRWSLGETKQTHPSIAQQSKSAARPDDEVFVENSPVHGGRRLVGRLLAMGWEYRCGWCGIAEWRGTPLVLHVDHINGICNDNRLTNLRILCPNCHSQTPTYGNRHRDQSRVV